jgi:hypothetical protein
MVAPGRPLALGFYAPREAFLYEGRELAFCDLAPANFAVRAPALPRCYAHAPSFLCDTANICLYLSIVADSRAGFIARTAAREDRGK